ncbi:hypothetical protein [Pseudobacillus badius]|uniref:hypothetical protein n=2 Tax=Pseudobacillus TaxID=108525 RepID=UPI003D34ADDA
MLQEKRSEKTYNYSKFIYASQQEEFEKTKKPQIHLTERIMKVIKVSPEKEKEIESKLINSNSKLTLKDFYSQKLLYPLVLVSLFLLLALFREQKIFFALALVSSLLYFMPNYLLNQRVEAAKRMRRIELPSYLTPLGLLMITYTPYQAVKKSINYAGPFLRPHVQQMISEMEMYPGSSKPYQNFSKNLGISEASTFIAALQQAFETDQSKSRDIINSQINFMRQMRTQNYLSLIELQPMKLTKYNMIPVVAIVAVVFTIVGTVMLTSFG